MGNGKAMVLIGVEDRHLNYGSEEQIEKQKGEWEGSNIQLFKCYCVIKQESLKDLASLVAQPAMQEMWI